MKARKEKKVQFNDLWEIEINEVQENAFNNELNNDHYEIMLKGFRLDKNANHTGELKTLQIIKLSKN